MQLMEGGGSGIEANPRPYYYSLWLVIYEFDTTSNEKCTYFDTVDQEFGEVL